MEPPPSDPASQRLARIRQRAAELLARRLRDGLCSQPARIAGQAEAAVAPSARSGYEALQAAREAGPQEAAAVGTAAIQLPNPPSGAAWGPNEPLPAAEAAAAAAELTGPAASTLAAFGLAAVARPVGPVPAQPSTSTQAPTSLEAQAAAAGAFASASAAASGAGGLGPRYGQGTAKVLLLPAASLNPAARPWPAASATAELHALIAAAFPASDVSPLARLSRSVAGYLASSPRPDLGPHTARVCHIGTHLAMAQSQGMLGADVKWPKRFKRFLQPLPFVRVMPQAGSSGDDEAVRLLPDELRSMAAVAAAVRAAAGAADSHTSVRAPGAPVPGPPTWQAEVQGPLSPTPPAATPRARSASSPGDPASGVATGVATAAGGPSADQSPARQLYPAAAPSQAAWYAEMQPTLVLPYTSHVPYAPDLPYMPYPVPGVVNDVAMAPTAALSSAGIPSSVGTAAGSSTAAADAGLPPLLQLGDILNQCFITAPSPSGGPGEGASAVTGAAQRCMAMLLAEAPPPHELGICVLRESLQRRWPGLTLPRTLGVVAVEGEAARRTFALTWEKSRRLAVRLVCPELLRLAALMGGRAPSPETTTAEGPPKAASRAAAQPSTEQRTQALAAAPAPAAAASGSALALKPAAGAAAAASAVSSASPAVPTTRQAAWGLLNARFALVGTPGPKASAGIVAQAAKRRMAMLLAEGPPPHELPASRLEQMLPTWLGGGELHLSVIELASVCAAARTTFAVVIRADGTQAVRLVCPQLLGWARGQGASTSADAVAGVAGHASLSAPVEGPVPTSLGAIPGCAPAERTLSPPAAEAVGPVPAVPGSTNAPTTPQPPAPRAEVIRSRAHNTGQYGAEPASKDAYASSAAPLASEALDADSAAAEAGLCPAPSALNAVERMWRSSSRLVGSAAAAAPSQSNALAQAHHALNHTSHVRGLICAELNTRFPPYAVPQPGSRLEVRTAAIRSSQMGMLLATEPPPHQLSTAVLASKLLWAPQGLEQLQLSVEEALVSEGEAAQATFRLAKEGGAQMVQLACPVLLQLASALAATPNAGPAAEPAACAKPAASVAPASRRRAAAATAHQAHAAALAAVAGLPGTAPPPAVGGLACSTTDAAADGLQGSAASAERTPAAAAGPVAPTEQQQPAPGSHADASPASIAAPAPAPDPASIASPAGQGAGASDAQQPAAPQAPHAPHAPAAAASGGAAAIPEEAAAGGLDKTHGQRLCRAALLLSADGESAARPSHADALRDRQAAVGQEGRAGRAPMQQRVSERRPAVGQAAAGSSGGAWGQQRLAQLTEAAPAHATEQPQPQPRAQEGGREPPAAQPPQELLPAACPTLPGPPSRKELWAVLNARFEPVGAVGPKAAPEVVEAAAKRWMAVLLAEAPPPHELSVTDLEPLLLARLQGAALPRGPLKPPPSDRASQRLARIRQRAAELLARRLRDCLWSQPGRIGAQVETAVEPSVGSEYEASQAAREAGPQAAAAAASAAAAGMAAPQLPNSPPGAASGPREPLRAAEAAAAAAELTGPGPEASASAGPGPAVPPPAIRITRQMAAHMVPRAAWILARQAEIHIAAEVAAAAAQEQEPHPPLDPVVSAAAAEAVNTAAAAATGHAADVLAAAPQLPHPLLGAAWPPEDPLPAAEAAAAASELTGPATSAAEA
ncbi:hypothetical protein HYH03_011402 [Edaphochlamys debaryana]|uniref:Uncharacterized protein n=1 Tax=Edaphochlamys debaryana TaxID=47281 RepID=A0A835XU00_9CHLO|nr:hypothetical protein HYH03_011402 [Edaphochlamys debaryana]|eukprot:KAG2490096.1 hypothetical protein HYH03_011402 [Edaphochlamys debaryana]